MGSSSLLLMLSISMTCRCEGPFNLLSRCEDGGWEGKPSKRTRICEHGCAFSENDHNCIDFIESPRPNREDSTEFCTIEDAGDQLSPSIGFFGLSWHAGFDGGLRPFLPDRLDTDANEGALDVLERIEQSTSCSKILSYLRLLGRAVPDVLSLEEVDAMWAQDELISVALKTQSHWGVCETSALQEVKTVYDYWNQPRHEEQHDLLDDLSAHVHLNTTALPTYFCSEPSPLLRSLTPHSVVYVLGVSVLQTDGKWLVELPVFAAPSGPCFLWRYSAMNYPLVSTLLHPLDARSCIFHQGSASRSSNAAAVSYDGASIIISCPVPDGISPYSTFRLSIKAATWTLHQLKICTTPNAARYNVAVCSSPRWDMYNNSHLIKQWLEYHRLVGVQHFWLYDIDASLSSIVHDYVKDGFVSYMASWQELLSSTFSAVSHFSRNSPPGLSASEFSTTQVAESLQKIHCIFSLRGRADWVLNLNSYDEYLTSPKGPFDVKDELHSYTKERQKIVMIDMPWVSFGGPPQSDTSYTIEKHTLRSSYPGRGSKGSDQQFGHAGKHVEYLNSLEGSQIVNPDNVLAQHAEMTRGRPRSVHIEGSAARFMRIQHYIDMHDTRCEACTTRDESALWALPSLRNLVPDPTTGVT